MAYITGSITSANPSADLYTAIAGALTTAGFTLVDTVVISTRTHKIWKSAAANNTQNLDWYLDVTYTTTGPGNMWFFPMEYFDPATDLGYRVAASAAGGVMTVIEQTYYSRYGVTGYALESVPTTANASNATNIAFQTSTSTFGYWISITGNRMIALSSVTPSNMTYSGMYTPSASHAAAAGASLFPLIYSTMGNTGLSSASTSTASTSAGIARYPKAAAFTIANGWGQVPETAGPGTGSQYGPILPVGLLTVNTGYQIWPVNIGVYTERPTAHLGAFADLGVVYASGVVRGDTFTVSGNQWVLGTAVSNSVTAFKAA